ncbi:flavin reductase family protein [Sphingomonas sp. MMS24-JH45]
MRHEPEHDGAELATQLKLAMRGLAKSVVLIATIGADGDRHAMVATAVTPLSIDRRRCCSAWTRSTSSYPAIAGGADFGINILSVEHLLLAHACSGTMRGEARFQSGASDRDASGVPFLADAQAVIICAQEQRHSYGTHDVVIGRVRSVHGMRALDPLVYVDGVYKPLRGDALTI